VGSVEVGLQPHKSSPSFADQTIRRVRRVGLVVSTLDSGSDITGSSTDEGTVYTNAYIGEIFTHTCSDQPGLSSLQGRQTVVPCSLGWGLTSSVRLQGRRVARPAAGVGAMMLTCLRPQFALLH
jgi:hypothetical protein